MKKLEVFFCTLIVSFVLLGCESQHPQHIESSTDNVAEYNSIEEFLLDAIQSKNTFLSTRLANIDSNSLEQTYYHLKIQKIFNIDIEEQTESAFDNVCKNKIEKDIYYLKYVDNIDDLENHIKRIQEYLSITPKITYDTIEYFYIILRYLGENNSFLDTSSIEEFLKASIQNESDVDNRLNLIYWYFDLAENNCIKATPKFISDCKKYIETDFIFLPNDFYKYEKLYYYLWVCKINKIPPSIDENIVQNIPNELPYTFLASEIYFAIKCLDIQKQEFDATSYFANYYNFLRPNVNGLYPSFVIESNNMVEEYRVFLLLKYIFDSKDDKIRMLNEQLTQITKEKIFSTDSATQSYYETLFCTLEGIKISQEKKDIIRKKVTTEQKKGKEVHNVKLYYYYLILDIFDTQITEADKEFILSQYIYLKSEKNVSSAVDFLDLISKFKLMKRLDLKKEHDNLLSMGEMTSEDTYYRYLILSHDLTGNKYLSNSPFMTYKDTNEMLLVQNDTGVMYISTIYYYLLSKWKDNTILNWR